MFQKNESVFNILFEAVSEGVIVVDENQSIVASNSAAEEIFGYVKNEIVNQHLNILIPAKHLSSHGDHFKSFYSTLSSKRRMGKNRLLFGVRKNNENFPVEVGLNPFEFENKKYVMSIIIDISERKQAEDRIVELNNQLENKVSKRTVELHKTVANLKSEIDKRVKAELELRNALKKEIELNELKTKFLSLVSHEFKTPLSGILNSAVLIGRYTQAETQDKRDKHLATIKNKVQYLDGILNDFLSVERLDSGKVKYKFSHFKISKVVNEVVYNANMMLKSGQHINYPKNIDDINIYNDEKILDLVLGNLLNNAIKYSPENTTIDFNIVANENEFIFEVIDAGIGIPEKDQKHIFERYFRAENVLTNQGTGIGLNIIKGHLESLKGTISFKSIENKGTTFKVKLPIIKEE